MFLALRLKKLFYILGLVWMPLSISMEAPQETIKKEDDEKSYLQLLPPDLVQQIGYFLTNGTSLEEAVQNIKKFPTLMNNLAIAGNIIKELSTRFNETPLKVAFTFNDPLALEGLKVLIQNNPSIGEKSLLDVADQGNLQGVEFFIKTGVNPNIQDKENLNTALMLAAASLQPEVVKFLLDSGANPSLQNKLGETALILATLGSQADGAKERRIKIVKLLIPITRLNKQQWLGNTALMLAAEREQEDIVDLLLQAQANPNLRNDFGQTALDLATLYKNLHIAKLLKDAGAKE
jgi:hypothetical protein